MENAIILEPVISKYRAKELGDNIFVVDYGINIEKENGDYRLVVKTKNGIYKIRLNSDALMYLFFELYDIVANKKLLTEDEIKTIQDAKVSEIVIWESLDNRESEFDLILEKDNKKYVLEILRPIQAIVSEYSGNENE